MRFRCAGIPYRTSAWVTSASGDGGLEKVTIRSRSGIEELACDMLAIGYHLVPNTELPNYCSASSMAITFAWMSSSKAR